MSTKTWRVLRFNEPKFAKAVAALNRHAQPEASRAAAVAEIIETVRHDGDAALVRYAKQWDKFDLPPSGLLLPARAPQVPEPVREAVDYALGNIRDFSKLRKPRNWTRTNRGGCAGRRKNSSRWSASASMSRAAPRRSSRPRS